MIKISDVHGREILDSRGNPTVEAEVTRVDNEPTPALYADGFLKVDGIYIYQMKHFGLKLVPL